MSNLNCYRTLIIALIPFFVSCQANVEEIKTEEQIDNVIRQEVAGISNKIYEDLKHNNMKYALTISSPEFKASFIEMNDALKNMDITSSGGKNKVDEFLLISNPKNQQIDIHSSFKGEKYLFKVSPKGNETFVYLFSIPNGTKNGENLVSLVLNRDDKTWELINMSIGSFTYKGQTAVQVFDTAKEFYNRKLIIPALSYTRLALTLCNPSNKNFVFDRQNQISNLAKKIEQELPRYYNFPFVIQQIKSNPEISGYNTQMDYGILYPEVSYYTKFELSNINDIQKENIAVHKLIDSIYPGINSISDSIFYIIGNRNSAGKGRMIRRMVMNNDTVKNN